MKLPGGKVISTKLTAIIAAGTVAVTGTAVGIILNLNGQQSFRSITVIDTIGTVNVFRESINDTLEAYIDMNLESGDDVTVEEKSELDLKLDDDKFVYIKENTKLWLEAEGDAENSKTVIHLNEGAVLNQLDQKLNDDSYYEVETPNATMAIRGTIPRVVVFYDNNGIAHTDFQVFEGKVSVQLHTTDGKLIDEEMTVGEGMQCKTRGDQTFSEIILQDLNGEKQQIVPINPAELPSECLNNLLPIVQSGRELKAGEQILGEAEIKSLLNIPEEEPIEEPVNITPSPSVSPVVSPSPVISPAVKAVPTTVPETTPVVTPSAVPTLVSESEAEEETQNYTVTFQADGRTFGSQTVTGGSTVAEPMLKPTSAGSWTLNGSAYNFSSAVNGNITLIWQ